MIKIFPITNPIAPLRRSTTELTKRLTILKMACTIFVARLKMDVPTAKTLWNNPAKISKMPWKRCWIEPEMLALSRY